MVNKPPKNLNEVLALPPNVLTLPTGEEMLARMNRLTTYCKTRQPIMTSVIHQILIDNLNVGGTIH
jgi:hypothetical protein